MTKINPTHDFIVQNFDKVKAYVESYFAEEGSNSVSNMHSFINTLGERYAICPASTKKEFNSAFPGGLVYHSLNLLKQLGKFASIMDQDGEIPKSSLVKVAILAGIGRVGTLEEDYYLPQESSWHKERGMFYTINPDLQFMKVPDRSLFLAQQANISLTQDEYLAILLQDGVDKGCAGYKYKEPKLALILQGALAWARKLEKENEVEDW